MFKKDLSTSSNRKKLYLRACIVLSLVAGTAALMYVAFWGSSVLLPDLAPTGVEEDSTAAAKEGRGSGELSESLRSTYRASESAYDPYYFSEAFDFAWPAYEASDFVLEEVGFTVCYDTLRGQPRWAVYLLQAAALSAPSRQSRPFVEDRFLRQRGLSLPKVDPPAAYRWVPLVPAADMYALRPEAFEYLFWSRNAVLQRSHLHEGLWQQLEEKIRHWARLHEKIYVVSGPVFGQITDQALEWQGKLPTHFFKVLLVLSRPTPQGIAFLMPQQANSSSQLWTYATHIAKVEERTGLRFFPRMPSHMQQQLKKKWSESFWK